MTKPAHTSLASVLDSSAVGMGERSASAPRSAPNQAKSSRS